MPQENLIKKRIILLIILSIINASHATNKPKKPKIKKIIETESRTLVNNNGKKYNNIVEINEIEYDTSGLKTTALRQTFYLGKPYETKRTNFVYDKNGHIFLENNFIVNDSSEYKTYYTYSKNKLDKKQFQFIMNENEYKFEEIYKYDVEGKLIKRTYMYYEKQVDSDSYIRNLKNTSKYNKAGEIIEMDWTESDSTYRFNNYTYQRNKKGKIIKEKEYDKEGHLIKTISYDYVYDSHKNWIVRKLFVNKSFVETSYREIEYYK